MKEDKIIRDENGLSEEEFLAGYDIEKYPRPSVTLDTLVFARDGAGELSVLLIKRRNHPFLGKWAFPGGFLNMDEDLEDGAARELLEETGVVCEDLKQLGAYGRPDRDPRGRIITVAYTAFLPEGAKPKAADDAKDAAMFKVSVDEEKGVISLRGGRTAISVDYSIMNGRAVYTGPSDLAGDHGQILADALLSLGRIK